MLYRGVDHIVPGIVLRALNLPPHGLPPENPLVDAPWTDGVAVMQYLIAQFVHGVPACALYQARVHILNPEIIRTDIDKTIICLYHGAVTLHAFAEGDILQLLFGDILYHADDMCCPAGFITFQGAGKVIKPCQPASGMDVPILDCESVDPLLQHFTAYIKHTIQVFLIDMFQPEPARVCFNLRWKAQNLTQAIIGKYDTMIFPHFIETQGGNING